MKRHKGRKPIELLNDYLDHIKTLKVQRTVPQQVVLPDQPVVKVPSQG